MEQPTIRLKSLIFDLYLKPPILVIGIYLIIVTATFTAQQLLLAAYLDDLGYIVISGIIIAVYFLFWFTLGPICGTLSDRHGRKIFLISSNWISALGFFGLVIAPIPIILFFMNAVLGFGAVLRLGSIVALWIQHTPQKRVGESLAYSNILQGVGGVGGTIIGLFLWTNLKEISFIIFGLLLFISSIPIFFITDSGDYISFSLSSTLKFIQNTIKEKIKNSFFFSKRVVQLIIHWIAFSAIVSFGTFIIPIFERLIEQIPQGTKIPIILIIGILLGLSISGIGGLLFWGSISDKWARKPVLVIGFVGLCSLILLITVIIQLELLPTIINDLIAYNPLTIALVVLTLVLLFMGVSLIPTPMAWIIDHIGKNDVAKAMSLRLAAIGIGTIVGTIIGGFIIGTFGLSGLFLTIFVFLLISAIILL